MAGARKSVSDTFPIWMRPNLSIERLAVTLAALGTTAVITACSRSEPAAVRPEQTPTTSASPPPPQPAPDEAKKNEGEKELGPTATATATASATPRRHMAPGGGDKGGTGQASCGAGTCTADPKKK